MSRGDVTRFRAYSGVGREQLGGMIFVSLSGDRGRIITHFRAYNPGKKAGRGRNVSRETFSCSRSRSALTTRPRLTRLTTCPRLTPHAPCPAPCPALPRLPALVPGPAPALTPCLAPPAPAPCPAPPPARARADPAPAPLRLHPVPPPSFSARGAPGAVGGGR